MLFINSLVAGATINAIAAFEEKSGWRGFLLNELKHQSFIKTSFTIGLIWGVWHAPIILAGHNYPDHPCHGRVNDNHLAHSTYPAFLYIRLKAKSVIATAIFHGILNGAFGISFMLVAGENDLLTGITGLTGFITLLMTNGILFY